MAWVLLLTAGLVEIVMVVMLKYTNGWTYFWPSVIGIAAALGSVFLLTTALKYLPVGTAYAIWTGIGAVGVTVLGIAAFNESATPLRLLCIVAITGGIIGLKLVES
jgi:quaternary ammonium compound-resistance protein SugE